MIRFSMAVAALIVVGSTALGQDAGQSDLKSLTEKASYTIGYNIGENFKAQEIEIDLQKVVQGLSDAFAGKDHQLSEEEIEAVMSQFQSELAAKAQARQASAAAKNKAEGDAYLAANAKNEGVNVLDSGLQYKVLTSGTGASPKLTDQVKTHYRGTLIDGTEFDSSYRRGEPAQFAVGGVIRGWTEALQLMKVGDKWELTIPSGLAYGPQGTGPIGPNSVLKFEIELLDIVQ